jgi:hypothetical protein
MAERGFLVAGGALMLLLGLARGAGGLVLLVRGPSTDPAIGAGTAAVAVVGTFLLLLGIALVTSAIGVLRRSRTAWWAGIACTIAFVIDGAINGTLLYGRAGDRGTIANLAAAAVILACLVSGRRALRSESRDPGTPPP